MGIPDSEVSALYTGPETPNNDVQHYLSHSLTSSVSQHLKNDIKSLNGIFPHGSTDSWFGSVEFWVAKLAMPSGNIFLHDSLSVLGVISSKKQQKVSNTSICTVFKYSIIDIPSPFLRTSSSRILPLYCFQQALDPSETSQIRMPSHRGQKWPTRASP